MIQLKDIEQSIRELENSQPTYQTCEKLADLYIVREHLNTIGVEGDSPFLKKLKGKRMDKALSLIDELMETLEVINPKLYESVLMRIDEL